MRIGTFLAWLCVATIFVTLVVGAAPARSQATATVAVGTAPR